MGELLKVLPQRLREAADALGSQSSLAKIVDKDRSTVNRWVQGTAEPGVDSLIAISNATGISGDYLFGLSEMRLIKESLAERYDLVIAVKNVTEMTQSNHVFINAKKVIAVRSGDVPPQHREG